MKRAVLAVLTLLAGAGAGLAQSTFHGDAARTGACDASGPRRLAGVKWSFKTDAAVVASPAVADGVVFVGSSDGTLYALDEATGAVRWKAETDGPIASSAAVSKGVVYVGSYDGNVYALAAATGAVAWKFATDGPDRRFEAKGLHGLKPADQTIPDAWDFYASSPAVSDGVVYVGSGDGHVYAIGAGDGKLRWKFATGGVVHASPAVANGTVYVGSWDATFYALDAATGAVRWRVKTGEDPVRHNQTGFQASAAVVDGVVYVGCRDAHVYALDAATGRELWNLYTEHGWVSATPAVRGGRVFVGTGSTTEFVALDAKTGRRIFGVPTKSGVFSSAAVTADTAYFGDLTGKLYAVDTSTGDLLWEFRTESAVKDPTHLFGADGKWNPQSFGTTTNDFQEMYTQMAKRFSVGAILSSPAVDGGTVFFGAADGVVYALR